MASAAQDLRYRRKQGMVDGSLAHDLDWVVRERELEHAGEAPRRRETVVENSVNNVGNSEGNVNA